MHSATGIYEVTTDSGAPYIVDLDESTIKRLSPGGDTPGPEGEPTMNNHHFGPALSDATEIGVMGDLHGELGHTLTAARMLSGRGVTTLVQLGDWGHVWAGENWSSKLDKLEHRLALLGQTMFFLLGNHDAYPIVESFPMSADGLRWVRPHLACMPRGWRTTIGGRYTFAAFGGANSIDREYRTPGRDWWPAEQITNLDLAQLGREKVDVLAGHEVPLGVPSLDSYLRSLPKWPVDAELYANKSRGMFHRALLQTRPQLTLGGHYHRHIDELVTYTDSRESFECRVAVLDQNGTGFSQAVLNTRTLALEFLRRNGTPHEMENHK